MLLKAALSALLTAALAVPCGLAQDLAGTGEEAPQAAQEESRLKEKLDRAADSLYELIAELMSEYAQGEKPIAQRLGDFFRQTVNWLVRGIRGLPELLRDSFEGSADPRWFYMDDQAGAMLTPAPDARGALSGTD